MASILSIKRQIKIEKEELTTMVKQTTQNRESSSMIWDNLEEMVRMKVREFIQGLMEAEIEELLGRQRCERRNLVDSPPVYRNGYGKERRLTLGCGTITVRRPRVRGLEGRFESQVLPLFSRRTREVNQLIPELYLHGLALGDFDLALRGLLGKDAPISAGTVARLKEKWQAEVEEWRQRSLAGLEVVYMWVDGVYIKAGLEKDKSALLVAIGGLSNGQKVVLAVEPGHRESSEGWSGVLRDLKNRGMNRPRMVAGDGNLGIWGALSNVYPGVLEQRCWNHKIMNVLDKLPKKAQAQGKLGLQRIFSAESRQEAEDKRNLFAGWCKEKGYSSAKEALERDWERMVTFYQFPKEHWKHLRTTNIVESPFAALRLRTGAAKRFKKVTNATGVIWKMLMLAEKRFRKLDAPDKLKQVYLGIQFKDGVEVAISRDYNPVMEKTQREKEFAIA
jgi:putative transposase